MFEKVRPCTTFQIDSTHLDNSHGEVDGDAEVVLTAALDDVDEDLKSRSNRGACIGPKAANNSQT